MQNNKSGITCLTLLLSAPNVVLSSCKGRIVSQDNAKSFSFCPTLINKSFTPEGLSNNDFTEIADQHDYSLVKPFLSQRIINPLPQTYLRISEWLDLAVMEEQLKNSHTWQHRVRRYIMQILFLLEADQNKLSNKSMIDIVLEHIHTNYSKEISLDALCKLVYINRTTLNRLFKLHTRRSPIDYLLYYRLSVACELLINSKLSISKIAEASGFNYDSYFTRQFIAKIGLTPSQYRQGDGFEILNIKESYIVDEY